MSKTRSVEYHTLLQMQQKLTTLQRLVASGVDDELVLAQARSNLEIAIHIWQER